MLDLIVLTADLDAQEGLQGLLQWRIPSLGIRPVSFRIIRHVRKDAGTFSEAPEILRPFCDKANHALVFFDHEGCGREQDSVAACEQDCRERLSANGWGSRAEVIVFDPELEIWAWSGSPHLDRVLGWRGKKPALRHWLNTQGLMEADRQKPARPKEAMEAAIHHARIQWSAALFREIARSVSLQRCQTPSFIKFKETLKEWFPVQ